MKRIGHTPGPWRIVDEEAFNVRVVRGARDEERTIAEALNVAPTLGGVRETLANAHLLAAAPELYAAALAVFEQLRGSHAPGERWEEGCAEILRAALAQARGEDPGEDWFGLAQTICHGRERAK